MIEKGSKVLVHMSNGRIKLGVVISSEKSRKYGLRYKVLVEGKEYFVPEKFVEKVINKSGGMRRC